MAKRIHYFGDINACAKHRHGADMLLNFIDKQDLSYGVVRRNFSDGSQIKVNKINPYLQTVDIYAGETKTKKKYEWTLVYAPCPLPDSQAWEGWIECDKEDLIADNWLSEFTLIPWGDAFYGDFTTTDSVTPVVTSPSSSVTSGGWGSSGYGNIGLFLAPVWESYGLERLGRSRSESICNYTFPSNLFSAIVLSNYTETGSKHFLLRRWPDTTDGFVDIALNPVPGGVVDQPPDVEKSATGVIGIHDPGYSIMHIEGVISWESLYSIGFWKWELISYTPSSYLDADNYCGFYEKYESDSSYATTFLQDMWVGFEDDYEEWFWSGADGYEAYWWTVAMRNAYIAAGLTGSGNHTTFPNSARDSYGNYAIHDPDSTDGSQNAASITYETHIAGKYEGVYFDTVIATATWTGAIDSVLGWVGSWSGDNAFAWMARVYDKNLLVEGSVGEERPSDHNLLIASWLIGPPDGNVSSTSLIPGLVNGTGINVVKYHARHGDDINVTKSYSATHPGWHDVYTDDNGNTWRAYGDLFAVLKEAHEEEEY